MMHTSQLLAAVSGDVAVAFVEIGLLALVLSLLARLGERLGLSAVPFYLIGGLGLGDGGIVDIGVSEEFVSLGAEIGVLMLLFTLGLEYSGDELQAGLRTGLVPGVADAVLNFAPGFVAGIVLDLSVIGSLLLGGVTWVSSSGVVSKVLSDLGRLGNRETPAVLNILVIEDLAMAVYLPVVAALIGGERRVADRSDRRHRPRRRGRGPVGRGALGWSREPAPRWRGRRGTSAFGLRSHPSRGRVGATPADIGGHRRLPRRSGVVGCGPGASKRTDGAAPRPVRRHLLPVLLVPDRSVRIAGRCRPLPSPQPCSPS